MSPEEVLALWQKHEATLAAIREALADVEAGRTRPAAEVMRELRAEFDGA